MLNSHKNTTHPRFILISTPRFILISAPRFILISAPRFILISAPRLILISLYPLLISAPFRIRIRVLSLPLNSVSISDARMNFEIRSSVREHMAASCSNNRYTNSYKGQYKPTSFFPHSCMYFDKRAFDSLSNFFRVIGIEVVLFLNSFPEILPSQEAA